VTQDHVLLNRREWDLDPDSWVERGREDMSRLLRRCGFEIEDLAEVQAPEDEPAETRRWYVEWERALRWPSVEVWKARKR
jgi:hypothetical protein